MTDNTLTTYATKRGRIDQTKVDDIARRIELKVLSCHPYRTSIVEPIPAAKGKVMRLGTKNTGSHLASNAAPGLRMSNSFGPIGSVRSVTNKAPHPARDEGKEMAAFLKICRKAISNRMRIDADKKGLASDGISMEACSEELENN